MSTLPLLTSKLLPVPHGFTLREGGVSEGPYSSLNLGFGVGDAGELVEENSRRVARAAGIEPSELFTVTQVHGDRAIEVSASELGSRQLRPSSGEADALFTARNGAAVGVKSADCVPVLIVDPVGRRVAAVHSGWRGTEKEVSARAVEALGGEPARYLAAIGPSIRLCCYTVAEELAQRFEARFGAGVQAREDGKVHLDLVRAVRLTLERAGLRQEQIEVLPQCTCCDARFYSHRRDGGITGRHLSFAVCRF
jgi:polyphenol oxidase